MNQGFLKLMVYQALKQGPCSGYTISKKIHEHTGWKPSFGSIYPLLQHLEHDGYVKVVQEGRSKLYSLTPAGKEHIAKELTSKKAIYTTITEHLRCLASMGDDEAAVMADMLEQANKTEVPFGHNPELLILRKELYRLMKEGKTNNPLFKSIIIHTTEELEKL
jgi:formylmethanofuran dehydrogenase subunit E